MQNKLKYVAITCFILSFCSSTLSQNFHSNLRNKHLFTNSDTIQLDSLSIVAESLQLFFSDSSQVPVNEYSVRFDKSLLIVNKSLFNQEIIAKYRVFPINLAKNYGHKDTSLIIKNYNPFAVKPVYINKKNKDNNEAFNTLQKSGSISRGLTFGNNRDVSTLSNLNLQLSGKINDEVSILAAISDNNIPIQPDGNTQKIQEFDKIYIKLFKENSGLTLGDIEMLKPKGYFLKLQKRTRGLNVYSNFDIDKKKKSKMYSQLTAGVAKGKYNRIKIKGVEGNQGPYRLRGNSNEAYIIVISGSEKVYINGKLLKRGQKFDYIIDYNTAELNFTANCIITKDSRITIEYEYTQQLYPNMQFMQNNYFTSKRVDAWLNVYLERDNKNDPLSENYTDDIKHILASSTNNYDNVTAPNIRKVEYDNNSILYKQIDTIYNGIKYDSIYVYSNNPKQAVYRLGFSYLGQNKGNYILENSKVNGKLYKWVAPKNGIMQGFYEPVNKFVTPKQKLVTNVGANIIISRSSNLGFEFALSNYDANTYSANNNSNIGYAFKINAEQALLNADTNDINLKLFANFKIVDDKFEPVENYNSVEFERNWNLHSQLYSPKEKCVSAGVLFSKQNLGIIDFSSEYMLRANNYNAKRAKLHSNIKAHNTQLISDLSYLLTDDNVYKTDYLKHKFELLQHMKPFAVGASEESENNHMKIKNIDSLSRNSFKFNEYKLFMRQADSSRNHYNIDFTYRDDYLSLKNEMNKISTAKSFQVGYNFLQNKSFKSKTVFNYRNVDYIDSLTSIAKKENYLSGRQEIYANMFKGSIRWSVFYESSSGLELKKQYQYIEVNAGQGQFTWIDYNNNNVKELDEFEIAKFSDQANYIRIFLPSNEYVRAYTTQISSSLILQPYKIWRKEKGVKRFISMFDNQFSYRISEKTPIPNYFPVFSSSKKEIISKLLSIRNNLRFTSINRKWQLNYEYNQIMSKNLLTIGSEEQNNENNSLQIKYKFSKYFTLFNTSLVGINKLISENFYWKNYKLDIHSNEINFQMQANRKLYYNLIYRYSNKHNKTGIEVINTHSLKVSANQKLKDKAAIQADCSYILTEYNGEANSPVSYQMLEGLQKGKNLVWNITYSRKISKIFYLSLAYNGRTAQNIAIIHNGSIQLRADF